METIALNNYWKPIVQDDGTFKIIKDEEALAQYIKQALLLWEEEYWIDTSRGVNYTKIFNGKGEPDPKYFINRVEGLGYGIVVVEYEQELNQRTRKLKINMRITSEYGDIEI